MDIMWNYGLGSLKFTYCFHTQRRTKPESPCLKELYDCQIQHTIKRLNAWYLLSSNVYSFKLSNHHCYLYYHNICIAESNIIAHLHDDVTCAKNSGSCSQIRVMF